MDNITPFNKFLYKRQQVTIAWISVTYQDGVQKICSIIQDYKHLEPQKEEKEHKLLIFQGGLKFVENEFFSKDFSNYNTV